MNNKQFVKLVEKHSNKLEEASDDLSALDFETDFSRKEREDKRKKQEKIEQEKIDDAESDLETTIGKPKMNHFKGVDVGNMFINAWAGILSNNDEISKMPFIQRGIQGWTEQIVKYLNDQKIKSKVPLIQAWLVLNCVKLLAGDADGNQKNLFPNYAKYLNGKELEDTTKEGEERSKEVFMYWEEDDELMTVPKDLKSGNGAPEVKAFTYFIKQVGKAKAFKIYLSIAKYALNEFINWSSGTPKMKKVVVKEPANWGKK